MNKATTTIMTLTALLGITVSVTTAADQPTQPPYSWRGINGSGVFPAGDLVTTFWDIPEGTALPTGKAARDLQGLPSEAKPGTRHNIVWRTLLPHWGHNAPVVMGDRVYLLCDEGWKSDAAELVCLDVRTGEILWQRPVDHLDAWPEPRATEAREIRAKELKRWREHMTWWNRFYWDNEKNRAVVHDAATWKELLAQAEAAGWGFPAEPPAKGAAPGRGRHGIDPKGSHPLDASLIENAKRCNSERIHRREGWTTYAQAWYGTTMGSVVGDGEFIYAVTALGAAACYDPAGKRRWVTDLGVKLGGSNPHHFLRGNFNISSPALAGDRLVYFHRDTGTFYGLETATGAIAWQVTGPPYEDPEQGKAGYLALDAAPRGYHGHMSPGGTPVVLDLGGTVVAIAGHGLAVRVSDGRLLGQVAYELPKGFEYKSKKGTTVIDGTVPEGLLYGGGYNSGTGHGDIYVNNHFRDYLVAARLSVEGDALRQETLWCGKVRGENRNSNLTWYDGKIYVGPRFGHLDHPEAKGYSAVDALTGALVHPNGGIWAGYLTGVGFTRELAVSRSGAWHDESLALPGSCTYRVHRMPEMQEVGLGLLCHPPQPEEVTARHIAFKGIPYLSWGCSGTTCWGNRIFIRSNDYLWCIGDPEKEWVPPEKYLK